MDTESITHDWFLQRFNLTDECHYLNTYISPNKNEVVIGHAKKDQTVKGVDIIIRDIRLHKKHCTLQMNNNQQWEISSEKGNLTYVNGKQLGRSKKQGGNWTQLNSGDKIHLQYSSKNASPDDSIVFQLLRNPKISSNPKKGEEPHNDAKKREHSESPQQTEDVTRREKKKLRGSVCDSGEEEEKKLQKPVGDSGEEEEKKLRKQDTNQDPKFVRVERTTPTHHSDRSGGSSATFLSSQIGPRKPSESTSSEKAKSASEPGRTVVNKMTGEPASRQ